MRDRETRNLRHNTPERANFSRNVPTSQNMRDGEERYAKVDGVLRLYVKQAGELWYVAYTRA